MTAAWQNRTDVITLLLLHGADPDLTNVILHSSALINSIVVMSILQVFSTGFNPNVNYYYWCYAYGQQWASQTQSCGDPALYFSVCRGHLETTAALLRHGASANVRTHRHPWAVYALYTRRCC